MTTPSIREVPAIGQQTNNTITVNLSSAVVAGDTVFIVHGCNNSVTYANLDAAPTTGSWTQFATYATDTTATTPQLKASRGVLAAGGAQSFTMAQEGAANHNFGIVVLQGTCTFDVAAGVSGTNEGSHDAPSVDPTTTDGLLFCIVQSRGPDGTTSYDTPAGFTMQAEIDGTNPMAIASKVLTSGSPTGTVTFTQSGGTWDAYKAISVVWSISSSDQNVSPGSIGSAEAFGTAVVGAANTIAPTGIGSGEAFGTATVSATNTIVPDGIGSAEAFGTAAITTGPVDVAPSGIGSAEAFGTAVVSAENTVAPTGIGSGEAFGTATISAVNEILPGGIGSAEAFGTATISATNEILPGGITSGEAFGNPLVALQGTQLIAPPSIASEEAFGTATVTAGAVSVAPTGIGSAETFGTAVITAGSVILPAGIGSDEAFGTPVLSAGSVSIAPAGIPSAEAFGTPTVTDSSLGQIIAPIGIPSGEAFGTPYVWIHIVRACDCSVLVDD